MRQCEQWWLKWMVIMLCKLECHQNHHILIVVKFWVNDPGFVGFDDQYSKTQGRRNVGLVKIFISGWIWSLSLAKAVNVVFVERKLYRKTQTHVLEWVFWVYNYECFARLISDAFVWFFDLMAKQDIFEKPGALFRSCISHKQWLICVTCCCLLCLLWDKCLPSPPPALISLSTQFDEVASHWQNSKSKSCRP